MFESEQNTGLIQEKTFSFDDLSELKLTPEISEALDQLDSKFNEEPGVKELYLYLKDRFGVLVNRDELDLECFDGKPIDKEQYFDYPRRINDVLYQHGLVVYKIPHYNQMILSEIFLGDKRRVLLPERGKILQQALKGVVYDEKIERFCRSMMEVKVRDEKLMSILSMKEQEVFLDLLLGPVAISEYAAVPLLRKIRNEGFEGDFKINRIYEKENAERAGEYYLERIVLNRGINLSE